MERRFSPNRSGMPDGIKRDSLYRLLSLLDLGKGRNLSLVRDVG
jgi:hypothetical protein